MLTNFPNGVSSFGIPQLGGGIPTTFGKYFFVDYRNGNDGNSGLNKDEAFKTLSQAYSKVVSNNNDVILIDGDSSVQEDSMITWSKNRVWLIGLGGGFITGQRTKLELSATGKAAAVAANITLTGVGNVFANLKIINEGTNAASISSFIDAGEANYFFNCSFLKLSDLNVATVADIITRGDSNVYHSCEFGFDTLTQSVARATQWIKNDGSTRMKHCKFIDCRYYCASSEATKSFIKVENTSSLAFGNEWTDCIFNNALISSASAAALTNAVTSASGLVEGNLLFIKPATNTTNFCAGITDQVQVVAPAASNNALEAVTPA